MKVGSLIKVVDMVKTSKFEYQPLLKLISKQWSTGPGKSGPDKTKTSKMESYGHAPIMKVGRFDVKTTP